MKRSDYVLTTIIGVTLASLAMIAILFQPCWSGVLGTIFGFFSGFILGMVVLKAMVEDNENEK